MGFSRRTGTRFGTQEGTKWPSDGVFSGVIDAALIAGGVVPRASWDCASALYSLSPQVLIRIERSSDNMQEVIGWSPSTGAVDEAAIALHCAGTNGYIVSFIERGGNSAYDLVQSTQTLRHKIYDSVTGVSKVGSLPAWVATSDGYYGPTGNSLGFTGSPNIATTYMAQFPSAISVQHMIGSNGSSTGWGTGVNEAGRPVAGYRYPPPAGTGGRCEFTPLHAVTQMCGYHWDWTAGGLLQSGGATCRQDGAALAEHSSATLGSMAMIAQSYNFGFVGATAPRSTGMIVHSTKPAGAVLAVFEAFQATRRTLAGY